MIFSPIFSKSFFLIMLRFAESHYRRIAFYEKLCDLCEIFVALWEKIAELISFPSWSLWNLVSLWEIIAESLSFLSWSLWNLRVFVGNYCRIALFSFVIFVESSCLCVKLLLNCRISDLHFMKFLWSYWSLCGFVGDILVWFAVLQNCSLFLCDFVWNLCGICEAFVALWEKF